MARFLGNAFSLGMLSNNALVEVKFVTVEEAKKLAANAKSVVGHQDTANLYATVLGMPVEFNRVTSKLAAGDELVVGQYSGPRLPEGAVSLPEGASIQWMHVTVA